MPRANGVFRLLSSLDTSPNASVLVPSLFVFCILQGTLSLEHTAAPLLPVDDRAQNTCHLPRCPHDQLGRPTLGDLSP